MDKQDKELIERANQCIDWAEACELERLAHSPEAKREIHDAARRLHIKEEASAGLE